MDDTKAERLLKILNKKKEILFERVQRIFDLSKKCTEAKGAASFKLSYPLLDKTLREFDELEMRINEISLEFVEDFEPTFTKSIFEMVEQIEGVANIVMHPKSDGSDKGNSGVQATVAGKTNAARLRTIEIPRFDGSLEHWPVFYELFNTLVHEDSSLSALEKMQHLTSRLTGSALNICKHVKPTSANYEIMWKALIDRYNDERTLASSYVEEIFRFPPLRSESREGIISVLDGFCAPIAALKQLNIGDVGEFVFLNRCLAVLDPATKGAFEAAHRDKRLPTYSDLVTFLEKQIRCLPPTETQIKPKIHNPSQQKKSNKATHFLIAKAEEIKGKNCVFCKTGIHPLKGCAKFLKLTPWKRFKVVKAAFLCLKCLSNQHRVSECDSVNSCSKCELPHNTLLHFEHGRNNEKSETHLETTESAEVPSTTLCSMNMAASSADHSTVILSTVVVHAENSQGSRRPIRFLLDSGSQSNFLTTSICRKLNLTVEQNFRSSVLGFGGSRNTVRGKTSLRIFSRLDSRVCFTIAPLVVDRIVDQLPSMTLDVSRLAHLQHLQLADEKFHLPGEIDGVLGAELFPFIMGGAKLVDSPDMPMAIETPLGVIVMGKAPISESSPVPISLLTTVNESIGPLIQRFWELEDISSMEGVCLDQEDIECERNFVETVQRDESGKYIVTLPFRENPESLGHSYHSTLKRFYNLEKRFVQNPDVREAYHAVISDYLQQKHMSLSPDSEDGEGYFIPHHAIFKPQSLSTPVRVVFDASSKTSSGKSLNDILHVGPKLQTNVVELLLNFRLFAFALTADIRQMYRQVWVSPKHRKFQKILWRFEPKDPVQVYELNSVVFGITSSPYLALRTVKQLVHDEGSRFPVVSEVVPRDMYMDDLITSLQSFDQAEQLYVQSREMFQTGGFELVKWSTNSEHLRKRFVVDSENHVHREFDVGNHICSILGLRWHPDNDEFDFKIEFVPRVGTKREILSTVARIFDPLGFLAPLTLYLKILVQMLWQEKSDWDQTPGNEIVTKWNLFQEQCSSLSSIKIPRFLGISHEFQLTLIGFSDASESGYGAVVYLRVVQNDGNAFVRLVAGKSKVAPTKTVSIPRLELCAALLLANLLQLVLHSFRARNVNPSVRAFTDSTIVLYWLSSSPSRWSTFVANRVAKIQCLVERPSWAHVDGKQNPADCLSRGLTPQELCYHPLWWNGPSWLVEEEESWPITSLLPELVELPEQKPKVCMITKSHKSENRVYDIICSYSSFAKLRRVMVYVLRFCRLLPRQEFITREDLVKSEQVLCRNIQSQHFQQDISALQNGKPCSNRIQRLAPFLADGLIRVGGRLQNAAVGFEYAHPIILPKIDPFVRILVRYYHLENLHTGPSLLLSLLRQNYWILSARSVVRKVIRECNICFRVKPKSSFPVMGNLPSCRVTQVKAFWNTGVDYAGPWQISMGRRQNSATQKAYICLFVCLATKAIHLELVTSLSTAAFLAAFKRFLSRRGACSTIYSDCGTNFVGAKRELNELSSLHSSREFKDTLIDGLSEYKIEWKFIPPSSPHFGGIWESNIKSVKSHLSRVIGEQRLTYEEFNTLLIEVEALMNSRPLCPLSEDPSEPLALTPAHFLNLTPLKSLPADAVLELPSNRLSRYQLLDKLVQSFWSRWSKEYLHELQVRTKWTQPSCAIRVGTVVLVDQSPMPPLQWPLGIVEEIFPGQDGVVRVAAVRTNKGIMRRPIVKLCPLPSQ